MVFNWTSEERTRFNSLIDEQMRIGCTVMCALAVLLFPVFAILDYIAHREHLQILWTVRVFALTFYILILSYIYFYYQEFNPRLISVAMTWFASFAITIQCIVTGGFLAPYYAGIMLVMITTMTVFPWNPKAMTLVMGVEILIYFTGCFLKTDLSVIQTEAFMNNMFMLFATGVIGVIGSWSLQQSRLVSFDRYIQLENAKKDLISSREMLQQELASEQNNVEVLVKEITHRKAELERALDLRKEFISLASHELNTPLTSLKLITQMVQQRLNRNQSPNVEDVKKLLKTYDEQIVRLTRIVTDMLDISRIENGRLTLEKNELDLDKLIKEIIEFTTAGYTAPIHYRSSGPVVGRWDRLRIEQVMLNLVTNALKYGNGKPVEVHLSREDHLAKIVVKDHGIGIPEEYQNKIFERFERAVSSYQFSGLGVGLYITKQIILSHQGQIEVSSTPGNGSEFRVRLPLEA